MLKYPHAPLTVHNTALHYATFLHDRRYAGVLSNQSLHEARTMKFATLLNYVFLLLTAVAFSQPLHARENESAEQKQKRIRTLVEMLASRNPEPEQEDRGRQIVPDNYDRRHQAVVYLAIHQLLAEGSDAFDVLIEHFNDTRYSYSYKSPQGNFNRTVGRVCGDIMSRNIEPYDGTIKLLTGAQHSMYRDLHVPIEDWWKQNRTRPLWEIQVDAIDHAIKFMEAADREKLPSFYSEAPKLSPEKFEKGRQENLKILREMRLSISAAKEPHIPKSIDEYLGKMILLPWQKPD